MLTDAQIAELKNASPGRQLVRLSSASADVVARVPSMAEMGELRSRLQDKAKAGGSMEWLVRSCVVYPTRDALNDLLNAKPILVEKWYQKLEAEAGGAEEIELSKL